MSIIATRLSCSVLLVAFTPAIYVSAAFGSSSHKCKEPACDVNAIGRRKPVTIPSAGDWYSARKEKEFGDKYAAALEQKVEIVKDEAVTSYLDRVAEEIAQNSDADIPITVRLIRRNDVAALTLPAGHLYLTTGLVLRLQGEGELASMLARGIAHTALHSVMRLQTRAALVQMAIPAIEQPQAPADNALIATLGTLSFQRKFEFQADYFGIQYVFKSGYDTNCFLTALETVWQPDPGKPRAEALSPFPPLADRMKMLHKEIDDILPIRSGGAVSTPEFDEFIQHLRQIALPESAPDEDTQPKLIRHDTAANH